MKTEHMGCKLWSTNVDLSLIHEECLQEIDTSNVTSILSKINCNEHANNDKKMLDLNMETLEKCKENDVYKNIPAVENLISVLTKENSVCSVKEEISKSKKLTNDENYEDMLYFVCNLCPFLCTKTTKIREHLENIHKTNAVFKQVIFKCPACANTFFHKMSLRSHLIYDHQVGNSDVKKILQAVLYYSKKSNADYSKKMDSTTGFTNTSRDQVKISERNFYTVGNTVYSKSDAFVPYVDNIEKTLTPVENEELMILSPHLSYNDTEPLNFKTDCSDKERITVSKDVKMQGLLSQDKQSIIHKCEVPTCKVYLHDATKLFYHVKCHIENGFKCLECEQIFSWWKPLTGHLWRIHKIDMELYACDKCDYKTFSLGKLNNIHRPIHSEAKPFICDVCNKGFKNSKQLRNHKVKHKDFLNKTIQLCVECNKMFSDRRQLRIHMDSVHKKLKPFLCSYCGYKGASKSSLRMHMRQHTGEKPFSCEQCSYTTADHNSLRRHKLRHTGQKPYKCAYCDYACIQSSTYKVHLKTKHPGLEKNLLFSCSDCQFRTVNKDMFLTHVSTMHQKTVLLCL
ncbi:zinc finger protein 91-like isoform X2 [Agrilus planipennis]|uniref:Zinc finger protein 91-like isoform X1 n=1 Tax=Agrilus planipennis TaxID=224129 RepID=A0A1W4XPB3_AGRPL|nr:zinc finger protein 91-like isoform X1 [Agrilus planipennis]XP_025832947.1 zinc finger protein 91-like isoform X1 [Agrilus planipennis]XP_025832948.1 zinc finger protein 91-like isoform X2 [Agrilus planipennis]